MVWQTTGCAAVTRANWTLNSEQSIMICWTVNGQAHPTHSGWSSRFNKELCVRYVCPRRILAKSISSLRALRLLPGQRPKEGWMAWFIVNSRFPEALPLRSNKAIYVYSSICVRYRERWRIIIGSIFGSLVCQVITLWLGIQQVAKFYCRQEMVLFKEL